MTKKMAKMHGIPVMEMPDKILEDPNDEDEKKKKRLLFLWFLSIPVVAGIGVGTYYIVKSCSKKTEEKQYDVQIFQPEIPSLHDWSLNVGGKDKDVKAKEGEVVRITLTDTSGKSQIPVSLISKVLVTTEKGEEIELDLQYDVETNQYYADYTMTNANIQVNVIAKADIGYYFHDKPAEDDPEKLKAQNIYYDETLCDGSQEIVMYNFEQLYSQRDPQPIKTIKRDEFDAPIYVGNKISVIPSKFLINCKTFNQQIIFDANNTCKYIGKMFMCNCVNFNQAFVFPDSLTTIDIGFMHMYLLDEEEKEIVSAYNNGGETLNLNKVQYLANNVFDEDGEFLFNCKNFKVKLEMPNIKEIPRLFMFGCESFEQELVLPESLDIINEYFMLNTYAMNKNDGAGKLVVNCPVSAFRFPGDHLSCAVTDKEKLLDVINKGKEIGQRSWDNWVFKIGGSRSEEFIKEFGYVFFDTSEPEKISHFRRTSESQLPLPPDPNY